MIVAALLGSRSCRGVLATLAEGTATPIVSERWVTELREVIARPKFHAEFTPQMGKDLIQLITAHALVLSPRQAPRISRDPDDDHLLELALEGAADAVVSGDKDLTSLGSFAGIPILMPGEFLARLTRRP